MQQLSLKGHVQLYSMSVLTLESATLVYNRIVLKAYAECPKRTVIAHSADNTTGRPLCSTQLHVVQGQHLNMPGVRCKIIKWACVFSRVFEGLLLLTEDVFHQLRLS